MEGGREHQMITENGYEGLVALSYDRKAARLAKPLLAKCGQAGDETQEFHPDGVKRLYLAIVNRAILDVLENGENSQAAERWLLSRDFDQLEAVFG
jgi:glycerate kinase